MPEGEDKVRQRYYSIVRAAVCLPSHVCQWNVLQKCMAWMAMSFNGWCLTLPGLGGGSNPAFLFVWSLHVFFSLSHGFPLGDPGSSCSPSTCSEANRCVWVPCSIWLCVYVPCNGLGSYQSGPQPCILACLRGSRPPIIRISGKKMDGWIKL